MSSLHSLASDPLNQGTREKSNKETGIERCPEVYVDFCGRNFMLDVPALPRNNSPNDCGTKPIYMAKKLMTQIVILFQGGVNTPRVFFGFSGT